jgi:hypothetical protein
MILFFIIDAIKVSRKEAYGNGDKQDFVVHIMGLVEQLYF